MKLLALFLCLTASLFAGIEKTDQLLGRTNQKVVDQIYDMLAITDQILSRHHIPYCIVEGSLLGAHRHNGFIPWDDDADMVILEQDVEKFLRLKKFFYKKGCRIRPHFIGYKIFFKNGLKKRGYRFPFIDLFVMKKEDDRYAFASKRLHKYWPNSFITEVEWGSIKRIPFGHLMLLGLSGEMAHQYLRRLYGNDYNEIAYLTRDHEKSIRKERVAVKLVTKTPASHSRYR